MADPVKALIVEDDPEVLDLLKDLLVSMGLDVSTATDGAAGLETFRKVRPRLVLTDLLIPKVDGIQVANTVKTESEGQVVVVIITAITHSLAEDLKASKADDSFSKPVSPRRLRKRLQQLVPELAP